MLDFLAAFCRILATRDQLGIRQQLKHPMARALPPSVRAEAIAIARAGKSGRLAPTRSLHFYYQTLQLLAPPTGAWFEGETPSYTGHHARTATLAGGR